MAEHFVEGEVVEVLDELGVSLRQGRDVTREKRVVIPLGFLADRHGRPPDYASDAKPSTPPLHSKREGPGRVVLHGLLDLRPTLPLERIPMATDEAVARWLAVAKVYAYASVD